jgi:tetratricopeptide (TPR) repeat protein
MMKRGLAVVALIGAVAGAAYLAYRYLRARQPGRESLSGAYVPQPLPSTGLSPAPVAMPAEVGIEAAEPAGSTGINIPRPSESFGEETSPKFAEPVDTEADEEPDLPSAAELEAEESLAEAEEAATAEQIAAPVEDLELPGETGAAESPDLDEADLAEALLEEQAAATEVPPIEDKPAVDLWSPSSGATQQVDPVLAHFEALAASEDIAVESQPELSQPAERPLESTAEDAAPALEPATEEEDEGEAPDAASPADPTPMPQAEPASPSVDATPRQDTVLEDTAAADALLDEGNAYFNVGKFALAIQRYDRAIQLAPRLVAAYYNRANARTRIGDYEGAQSDYDTALGLNPTDADALNNRGMLHLYRGNHDAALQDFNLALGIDSRDGTVIVNRGLAYLHKGDPRAALSDFHEAIRLDSRDAAAHYGAAQSLATIGDTNAALMSLRNALRIEPNYAREAAAEPRFVSLQSNEEFTRILRNPNS